MKRKRIEKIPVGVFILWILFISCNGQNNPKKDNIAEQTSIQSPTGSFDFHTKIVKELSKNIGCIFEDKMGNYWFGTYGEGIYRYDNKTLIQFTNKDGLCSNFVSAIEQDIDGNLWFTTSEGLCRFDGGKFTNFTETLKNTTTENLQYKKDDLFFSQDGNVYNFNGKIFSKFIIHPSDYQPSATNLERPYGVYCFFKDKTGNLWFGTDQKGVCRYDGKTFTYFTDKGLNGGAVRTIFQDRNGILWFGNNGYGLFRYDGKTLTNFTEQNGLENPDFLKKKTGLNNTENLARVWTINEDKEGNLWIGTIDSGVWRYDGKKLTHFTTKDGLANNKINTIYKDRKNDLWFVTEGEGIFRFNGQKFEKFH